MSERDNGGPAEDMTARDIFAGLAMVGMLASETNGNGMCPQYKAEEDWLEVVAAQAGKYADAMIAVKRRRETET